MTSNTAFQDKSSKQSYVKDILFYSVIQILDNCKGFLLIPVIAKTLGAAAYGIWIQVNIGIAFLCPLLLLGLNGGITRFLPGSKKEDMRDGVFSSLATVLGFSIVPAFSIILVQKIISGYIGSSITDANFFIPGIALLCITEPLNNLLLEYFRSIRKIKILVKFSVLDTIFEFAPVIYLAYNGFSIGIIIFFFACGRMVMAGIKGLSAFYGLGLGGYKMDIVIKFIKFGFPLILLNIFFYISNYLDRYLIGYFYSAREVGIYSVAYTIGYIVIFISAPWDSVLVPTITKHWNDGNRADVRDYFNNTLKYILIITIPVVVFLSFSGKEIIRILTTTEFLSASYIIPIMSVAFLIFEVGIFYRRIVLLAYAPFTTIKAFGITAAVSVISNIILIPKFSITGAAVSLLITHGIFFAIFYKLTTKKNMDIANFDWVLILKCLLAVVPSVFFLISTNGTYKVFMGLPVVFFSYLFMLWAFKIIGKREYMFIRIMLSQKYKV